MKRATKPAKFVGCLFHFTVKVGLRHSVWKAVTTNDEPFALQVGPRMVRITLKIRPALTQEAGVLDSLYIGVAVHALSNENDPFGHGTKYVAGEGTVDASQP